MAVWRTCLRCLRRYNAPDRDREQLCKTCELAQRLKKK